MNNRSVFYFLPWLIGSSLISATIPHFRKLASGSLRIWVSLVHLLGSHDASGRTDCIGVQFLYIKSQATRMPEWLVAMTSTMVANCQQPLPLADPTLDWPHPNQGRGPARQLTTFPPHCRPGPNQPPWGPASSSWINVECKKEWINTEWLGEESS